MRSAVINREMKDFFSKGLFNGEVRFDEPMSAHTSLRIGGPAEILAFPEDPVSLKNILLSAKREQVPVFIFGGGTNLLVSDGGIEGIVISLKAFNKIEFTRETNDKKAVLYVGAGVPLAKLISFAQKNGCAGIEALAGIPGYFGGAVYMNAGSFGVEIKDVLVSIALMDINGEIRILQKDDLNFSYRSSNLPGSSMILSANISLNRDKSDDILNRIKEFLRKKRETQPLLETSAGCVFKNPAGGDAAGRLIDAAGCKEMRIGDVEVSAGHANYFINKGRATYMDFIALMEKVKLRVKEHSGVVLEPEIKIVGREISH
jgi:UDP-N-acetylmuramate dehydrogenase